VIDFEVPPDVAALRDRVREFVRDEVIPREVDDHPGHGLDEGLRRELQDAARRAGLLTPQAPVEEGGHGLDHRGQAVVFEEAGYSLLGPQALNCAAPDEGNMHLLREVGNAAQRERYLMPVVRGEARSCFAMTEPAPGAGSDPSMLRTTARRDGDEWVIDGVKWFITGAEGAAFAICMARTGERIERTEGATMFMVDAGTPGFEIRRVVGSIDRGPAGGHCEVEFAGCRVSADAVLGEVGLGYHYAQVRLGPARLTHCMRWLGLARRALDVALDRAREREAFGQRLEGLGMVQAMIADCVLDLEASRMMIWRCAGSSTAAAMRGPSRRRRRSSWPRRSGGWSTGRCRSAARWASRTTCRWPATSTRCAASASTTARPRRTAGRSLAARPATGPARSAPSGGRWPRSSTPSTRPPGNRSRRSWCAGRWRRSSTDTGSAAGRCARAASARATPT
jgi:acyl-CoA dehydrogenase